MNKDIETLAAAIHDIYQAEAKRQGDVRHKDSYEGLPDNVKEFDRVIARFILNECAAAYNAGIESAKTEAAKYSIKDSPLSSDERWHNSQIERLLEALDNLLLPTDKP